MIQALAKKYGLRWGGDYRGRKDEMHFEVIVTKKQAKKLAVKLGLVDKANASTKGDEETK
jgi:hypothetical protein